jgi:hypothetical protein
MICRNKLNFIGRKIKRYEVSGFAWGLRFKETKKKEKLHSNNEDSKEELVIPTSEFKLFFNLKNKLEKLKITNDKKTKKNIKKLSQGVIIIASACK